MKQVYILFTTTILLLYGNKTQAQITNIPLTSASFNFDCVAEASPPVSFTTGSMPGDDVIYSTSYPGSNGTGMPASNSITDGSVTYVIQPYDQNNSLEIGGTIGDNGELIFQSPTASSNLHFAAFSVFGTTGVDIVVTFSDNSTEQIASDFTISDWFNGNSVVHILDGRVTFGGTVHNQGSNNPRIYTYSFPISIANQSKFITKATITRTGGPSTSKPYFMAVAGEDVALSVEEFNKNRLIEIYPNPSSGFLTITNLNSKESYRIYNALGSKVKNGIISNEEQIDIRNFTNGLYFLKFENGNTIKFIKE